jgi:cell wall-associated NlpC family hydrolase
MTEEEQRAAVIAEAKTWLRTPYHHRAHVKGGGVDCAYLLIEVYHACGLIPSIDPGEYPPDWMMHREEERYLGWVKKFAHEVETPRPGDIALYHVGRCFAHGAIVVDWPTIIHAYIREKNVQISLGNQGWLEGRKVKYFSLWGD